MIGVLGKLESSLLLLLASTCVLVLFLRFGRADAVRTIAERRRKQHFRGRSVDKEMKNVQRMIRFVLVPAGSVVVAFALYNVVVAAIG
jgi:uncharacterized membrane protein YdjX (TVP38/TMEM64 family)